MPKKRIFVVENGYVLELDGEQGSVGERIAGGYVFVEGTGVGDVGAAVMRHREILSQDGFVVAAVQLDPQTRRLIGEPQMVMPVVWEDSRPCAAARAIMIGRPKRTCSPKRWSRIIICHSNVQPVILNFSVAFRAAYTCTLQV